MKERESRSMKKERGRGSTIGVETCGMERRKKLE